MGRFYHGRRLRSACSKQVETIAENHIAAAGFDCTQIDMTVDDARITRAALVIRCLAGNGVSERPTNATDANKEALAAPRPVARLAAEPHVLAVGSNNSAVGTLLTSPVTRTLPNGSSVAEC